MHLPFFKKWVSNLQAQILAGLILGILAGIVLGERAALLEVVGRIFIRLLMVVILPLVIASIFVAVAGFSDLARLGRLAGLSVGYILLMTALAAAWGVASALVIKPGRSLNPAAEAKILSEYQSQTQARLKAVETKPTASSLVLNLVPSNPFQAAAEGNLLQMILFTAFFAWGAAKIAPDKRQALFSFFDAVNAAAGKMIQWVLRIAPVGVFALMAVAVGKFGLELLVNLGTYVAVVVVGMVMFFFLAHFVVVHFIARRSFLDFWKSIRAAQIMAAATTSSMVTLPVSLDCAENSLHVPTRLTRFVLPLAATIGHDGAGIYQGVSAVFVAQLYGIRLSFYEILMIIVVATLAGLATASIPSGGFINLAITIAVLGVPMDGLAFLLGIDRLIDMFRTALNVTGQLTATVFVESKMATENQ
jgi:Na+/H+-dicarboxylate symporter